MNAIIFYYHPHPSVAEADKFQPVYVKAGRHHRNLYVRAELFAGNVDEANTHAAKSKGSDEIILSVQPYEA